MTTARLPQGYITEEFLQDLVAELEIPPSRYEAAERSYKAVGEWLHRQSSTLRAYDPQVYIQGSFRLGTAIRPVSGDEDYDVDLVCELNILRSTISQSWLKTEFGKEMSSYASAHNMDTPEEGRRCWTLNYADGAQFHLDALPAVPEPGRSRTRIAITDNRLPGFRLPRAAWPYSDPKAYAEWFKSRMIVLFERARQHMARTIMASVEDIPDYKVKTPLQQAIMLLKRHRDITFDGDIIDRPISIIITTLAAQAYQQEETIQGALESTLRRMHLFIENRGGVSWVPNPTNPDENFADKWAEHPERKEAFDLWLAKARQDFAQAAIARDRHTIAAQLAPALGERAVNGALARRSLGTNLIALNERRMLPTYTVNPPHLQALRWPFHPRGNVTVRAVTMLRTGFLPKLIANDGQAVPKRVSLVFQASTDIPKPFQVYWQVVNTGDEARAAQQLRGGFLAGHVKRGKLSHREGTSYRGCHAVECLIVKNGVCVARSGQFIVNIQ